MRRVRRHRRSGSQSESVARATAPTATVSNQNFHDSPARIQTTWLPSCGHSRLRRGEIRTPSATCGAWRAISRGKEVYEHGVETAAVPPCLSCHGPGAEGGGNYPRLAGQHAQYVLKQLNSFQNNMRDVAIMHGVAQGLKLAEMRAVAAYVQAQP